MYFIMFQAYFYTVNSNEFFSDRFLVDTFPLREKCPTIAVTVFFFRLQSSHWSVNFLETILKPPKAKSRQGKLSPSLVPRFIFYFFKETYKTGRA